MPKTKPQPIDQDALRFTPVSPTNWPDMEALFESKGGPAYCWCMAWRFTKAEGKDKSTPARKSYMEARVQAGTKVGLLGYHKDEVIAWCSIAPRETYRKLGGEEDLEKVWSIVCFFIKRPYREQGLMDRLIKEAEAYAKANGAQYLEATPVAPDAPSYRFMGFTQVFEKAGFQFVKMAGARRHVMLKKL